MVIGKGSTTEILDEKQIYQLCAEALSRLPIEGKHLLIVLPDHSRTAPIDVMFRTVYSLVAPRVQLLDFLIALGTHPPMSDAAINQRVGITPEERISRYPKARFFNHFWNDPRELCSLGVIPADEVGVISDGLMHQGVNVTINKMVYDYDLILIIGPTFPHEVAGFSGGNKYLFPGIAGQEIIDMFHWLGALITNPAIIGVKHTPVRRVVDRAAAMVPVERMCISLVVREQGLAGLYIGTPEEAWSAAADLSDQLHILYQERPYRQVLSCCPKMYDDLWTGGKCMYKMEPVVADGGELIIYAPHIREISVTHGAIIEKIGYHVRDYFLQQMDRFREIPGGVMAHSTHVRGVGTFENGVEKPRVNVVLATGISEEICRRINLDYRDPATIQVEEFQNREEEGILYVAKAGEMLYRLRNNPSRN